MIKTILQSLMSHHALSATNAYIIIVSKRTELIAEWVKAVRWHLPKKLLFTHRLHGDTAVIKLGTVSVHVFNVKHLTPERLTGFYANNITFILDRVMLPDEIGDIVNNYLTKTKNSALIQLFKQGDER